MVAITASVFTGFWSNAAAPYSHDYCSATSGSRPVTTITGMANSSWFPFNRSRTPTPSSSGRPRSNSAT